MRSSLGPLWVQILKLRQQLPEVPIVYEEPLPYWRKGLGWMGLSAQQAEVLKGRRSGMSQQAAVAVLDRFRAQYPELVR